MKIIERDSSMSVHGDFTMSSTDQKVLALLYLPIIKSDAFSLYEMLYSLSLNKTEAGFAYHDFLLSFLGLEETRFLDARSHLEAVGLIETYRKESKDLYGKINVSYLYRILPPATPKKFFDDPLLRTALSSFVDGKMYLKLKSQFLTNQPEGFDSYRNISSGFKDVFSLTVDENAASLKDNGLLNISKSYKKQSGFSFSLLENKLHQESYVAKIPDDEKKKIMDVCSIYSVTEDEACDLVLKNTTTDDFFVYDGFLKDVQLMKKYVPMRKGNRSESYNQDGKNSQLLKLYTTITPKKLLSLYFNAEPAGFMMDFLMKLKNECQVDDSVLNVALDYSLKNTNREFRENYIEKVVYSLSANHIDNCYDAMVYLSNHDYEARKAKSGRKSKIKNEDAVEENKKIADMDELAKDLGL